MRKELEKFYKECDETLNGLMKMSDISVTDMDNPEQAYMLASCMKIYNDGKDISLDAANEFEEVKEMVKENNKLLKELLEKIDSLESKRSKEKQ